MAEHKRGKMKNISGGVSDLICATNIFPLTRHVWPGPLQRVSCKKKNQEFVCNENQGSTVPAKRCVLDGFILFVT